jgi:3-isopropylmalate dehydrogenase
MKSGVLWKQVVTALHAAEFSDVSLEHVLADNCAMQLVRNPKQYDVIVCDNLFGDILSDVAAMLTGSLGMLPSASLNETGQGMYEPVHGSAPDIAGRNEANPLATILSLAMLFRHSLDEAGVAKDLEAAVGDVLDAGLRTGDIAAEGVAPVGTDAMTDAVIDAFRSRSSTGA